jgi:hypothetical protein
MLGRCHIAEAFKPDERIVIYPKGCLELAPQIADKVTRQSWSGKGERSHA